MKIILPKTLTVQIEPEDMPEILLNAMVDYLSAMDIESLLGLKEFRNYDIKSIDYEGGSIFLDCEDSLK